MRKEKPIFLVLNFALTPLFLLNIVLITNKHGVYYLKYFK